MRMSPWFSRAHPVAGAVLVALALVACGGGDSTTPPPGPAHGAWLASGPGTVTLTGDGLTTEPALAYSLSGDAVFNRQTWQISTAAPKAATLTLPFTYQGYHAWYYVKVFVEAFVIRTSGTQVDTVLAQGPVNCCAAPSGGFNLSGSATFTVAAGDIYGFRFGGSNYDTDKTLTGTFKITSTP